MSKIQCKPLPQLSSKNITNFKKYIDVRGADECWPWKISKNKDGYGKFIIHFPGTLGSPDSARTFFSSRIAFYVYYGRDPYPLLVLHTCDNPACCNPRHLFLGTDLDNKRDMASKGREARGLRSGVHTHPERFPKGESHYAAKLTKKDVDEIRSAYSCGYSQYEIAERFEVTRSNISRIVNNETWK